MDAYRQKLARFFESFAFPAEENGIGTLGEKKLHAALKRFYAKDSTCLEVPLATEREMTLALQSSPSITTVKSVSAYCLP